MRYVHVKSNRMTSSYRTDQKEVKSKKKVVRVTNLRNTTLQKFLTQRQTSQRNSNLVSAEASMNFSQNYMIRKHSIQFDGHPSIPKTVNETSITQFNISQIGSHKLVHDKCHKNCHLFHVISKLRQTRIMNPNTIPLAKVLLHLNMETIVQSFLDSLSNLIERNDPVFSNLGTLSHNQPYV